MGPGVGNGLLTVQPGLSLLTGSIAEGVAVLSSAGLGSSATGAVVADAAAVGEFPTSAPSVICGVAP